MSAKNVCSGLREGKLFALFYVKELCLYLCICMYSHVHVCLCVGACMWRPEANMQSDLADLTRLAGNKLQGAPPLCLPSTGFKGRLNLGPHICP